VNITTKISDAFARSMTAFFRFFADTFFRQNYGKRALILETVAGVPGMVGGMLTHLYSLRRLQKGNGTKIQELLDEATNERKHLMFFMEIVSPSILERVLIIFVQFVFWHYYLLMYMLFPRTAHRMTGYFEEEAVQSYTNYLYLIESGKIENVPAPQIAIDYYIDLQKGAMLSDMIVCVRRDEMYHAKINHGYANEKL
jgi:ubiquinol oxidase